MPGMSGLELQSLLRAQGRELPIIFITAFPEETARKRALDAGAVCFLIKPFDGPTLIKYLDKALQRDGRK
jgi:FixJ family two-component response regulator